MRTVQVQGVSIVMPEPVYILPQTTIVSGDGSRVEGSCCFPESDPTISDRGHVNIAHYFFALWNVAYVTKQQRGWKSMFATEGYVAIKSRRPVPSGAVITFVAHLESVRSEGTTEYGTAQAEFFAQADKVAELVVQYVARR